MLQCRLSFSTLFFFFKWRLLRVQWLQLCRPSASSTLLVKGSMRLHHVSRYTAVRPLISGVTMCVCVCVRGRDTHPLQTQRHDRPTRPQTHIPSSTPQTPGGKNHRAPSSHPPRYLSPSFEYNKGSSQFPV